MDHLEKISSIAVRIITSIFMLLACTIIGFILGLIIHELLFDSIITLIIGGAMGLFLGVVITRKSNRMGFFNFITKLSATNELDDPDLVDDFYNKKLNRP